VHVLAVQLVVSAHWEEDKPTVMVGEKTELLFDYYGFPADTYRYQYPAPGSPAVAQRVQQLLSSAGLPCGTESKRGLDHGAFVPLIPAFPDASIPVLQLSLVKGLDPSLHNTIGHALRPLRDEGVLILGSGMSFHNMGAFMKSLGGHTDPSTAAKSLEFDTHLTDVCTNAAHCRADAGRAAGALCVRQKMLTEWRRFPHAEFCHPREEHLAPLFVCAGAAGTDAGEKVFHGTGRIAVSSYRFG
jgi:aromatic ring-opening dioxygenase catalytic subunit (LigB family)